MPNPTICFFTKTWRFGTGWFAQALAQAMAEQGATVEFIAPRADPEDREPSHPRVTRRMPPRELDVGSRTARRLASVRRMIGSCAHALSARARSKLFLTSIPEPLPATLPVLALLRLTGARVVFIVHDPLPHAWSLPLSLRFVERWALGAAYRLASHLVVLAEASRQTMIREFAITPDRISVIPHGAFAMARPAPAAREGHALVFGTLRRNKGVLESIEGVIEARRRGSDVRLTIAGAPHGEDPSYWKDCEAAIATDPDAFDLEIGFVSETRVGELIAEHDLFLLPYTSFESQSGVAVLAGLNARPVLSTLAGGIAELHEMGLVGIDLGASVTAVSIADGLEAYRGTPASEWSQRAIEGAERLAQALDWSGIARRYIAVLTQTVSDSRTIGDVAGIPSR